MRILFLMALLMSGLATAVMGQQGGRIEGTITDADGAPLPGINVYLDGTIRGTTSDADGAYQIERIPSGSYTLIASGIGYRTQRRAVTVPQDVTVTVDFVFDEAHIFLPEVEVIGRRQTTYTSDYTFVGT